MKRILGFLGVLLFAFAGRAAAQNSAPSITAAGTVFLTAGDPGSSATIAAVSDAEDGAGSLGVSVLSAPSGISVSNIVNTDGSISAVITVGCDASAGDNSVVLEVADSENATATTTFVVNVRAVVPPSIPSISATANGTGTTDQACPEQPLTLTASAANATSYQWYDDGSAIYGATNATYNATGRGSFTATASNACFTSAQSFFAYNVSNPTPHKAFVTASGSTSLCTGGSVTLTSDSATGIQWYRDGVAISGGTHQSYVATTSGSYTAILNALGCHSQESDPITVTLNATPPTPAISGPDTTYFCAGGSVTLTSSSTSGNQWYINGEALGGSTGQTYVAEVGGEYTVVVDNNGCFSAASDAFHVDGNVTPHRPVITANGSTNLCTGGSVVLESNAATGIQWYRDGVAISGAGSQSYIASTAGEYTCTLNALGCISPTSDPVTVTMSVSPDTPTITATENATGTSDQACPEQPLTLTANSSTAESFQWYSDDAPIGGETSSTLTVTARGNYSATATANGCTTPRSAAYVVQNPTPHRAFLTTNGATTFCAGGSVTISSDSATGIQWYRDGVAISGGTHQSYVATTSGSYTAILNALGCHSQESDPIVVTVNAYPDTPAITATENATGTSDQTCPEQPLTLTANSSTAESFQWYSDDAPIDGATSSTYIATGRGNYSATATANGCTTARSAAYVVQNPTPHRAFLTTNGATTFCAGGNVTISSDSATGIQWYRDGVAISGGTHQSYVATTSGSYTAILNALGCHSQESDPIVVTVNAYPEVPAIDGSDFACPEVPATLTATSSGATSFQWYIDGGAISGETSSTLTVTGRGSYTVTATSSGCTSAQSAAHEVSNPTPHKAFITTSGSTSFCSGGSVTLMSDSATGIQWYRDGVAISGAGSQNYVATQSGSYTAILNALGCHSQESDPVVVTVNAYPDATITAPANVVSASTGNSASVASAGTGATYNWSITGGTITSGGGTSAVTFTAGSTGTLTLQATVTTSAGCSATQSASVNVVAPVTVTNVTPSTGSSSGGTSITIKGSGFAGGATVTLGGTAATSVVVVSSTKITATTPAHGSGAVDVVVTNSNSASGTLANGFTYKKK